MPILRANQGCRASVLAALVSFLALIPAVVADDALQAPSPLRDAQPAGPRLDHQSSQPAQPPDTQFWMVSSHHAAQHRKERSRGPLIYHRRTSAGWETGTEAGFQTHFAPGVPVAIFVHGSFVDWQTKSLLADATWHWLRQASPGRPLHFVVYNWPSGRPYTHLLGVDVAVRGCRAEFNGFHLSNVMTLIPHQSPVVLIGHSHGARTALATLHLASGGAIHDHVFIGRNPCRRRLRAIVAAAAVDHNWLDPGERYDHALLGADVINFKNCKDLPLNFYPLVRPFGRPTLATVGFTDGDRRKLGPLGWRAVDVDVTELIRQAHTWPSYLQSPAIAAAMMRYIYFDDEIQVGGERAAFRETAPLPRFARWWELDD